MPRIFISYRRADSKSTAGRIYDRLRQEFGKPSIFKDVDSIPVGVDFRGVIRESVSSCDIVLVVIGQNWLNITNEHGTRRLDEANDFVRLEIEAGLQSDKAWVIPILVDGASMPKPEDFPSTLHEIAFRNAVIIRDDPDFHRDMDRFIEAIRQAFIPEQIPEPEQPETDTEESLRNYKLSCAIVVAIALTIFIVGLALSPSIFGTDNTPTPPTTIAQDATETPTLSAFQQLQTAEAKRTQTAEANATFELLAATETSAYATLIALGATPTPSPTETPETPTATDSPSPTLSPEQIALTPQTSNAGWLPSEKDFDGVTMVLVPAGCFMMGSNDIIDERPVHEQCFNSPFWIDKYEVTNSQYGSSGYSAGANRPRDSITWFLAKSHCESRSVRLPTEAEWEYSARGPDGWLYPWGNDWNEANAVGNDGGSPRTVEVGSIPAGMSWVGALDMSGNVWEWTSSQHKEYPYNVTDGREIYTEGSTYHFRVMRGGAFSNTSLNLRGANRSRNSPISTTYSFGFRCARDFEE